MPAEVYLPPDAFTLLSTRPLLSLFFSPLTTRPATHSSLQCGVFCRYTAKRVAKRRGSLHVLVLESMVFSFGSTIRADSRRSRRIDLFHLCFFPGSIPFPTMLPFEIDSAGAGYIREFPNSTLWKQSGVPAPLALSALSKCIMHHFSSRELKYSYYLLIAWILSYWKF